MSRKTRKAAKERQEAQPVEVVRKPKRKKVPAYKNPRA